MRTLCFQEPASSISFASERATLRLLGASRSVTGAMSWFDLEGHRVLVDCGATQGQDGRADETALDDALQAEAVLLTHGHFDHVGQLPMLAARGYGKRVFATPATLSLARIVLDDSLRLGGADEDERRRFQQWLRRQAVGVPYGRWQSIGDLRFAFREAGHILGSSSVELRSPSVRVIVSGDVGRAGIPILRSPCTSWDPEPKVDLVLLESTYGDRVHAPTASIEDELERVLRHALADGGHVLVPAFAIGRTQTLLYHLNALVEAGRLQGIPVAVDTPMGLRVTALYEASRHLYDEEALERLSHGDDPLDFDGLYAVNRGWQSRRLRDANESMIILAGSGMCTGGRIVGHLRELLPRKETDVLFVGYQAQGTPGRAIVEAARARDEDGKVRSVELDGERVEVVAQVVSLPGLSAHADQQELLGWLHAVPRPELVVLHHGERDAQEALAERIQSE